MRAAIVVAATQPHCVPYDVAANAVTHAETVRAAGARVVAFPELSLTGYELDAPAVDPDDARLAPIVAACADTGSIALAGAPIPGSDGREHIATLAIDGTGVTVAYRKVWLDTTESRFAPGVPATIDVDGWRLGLGICKDTGIARHAADTAALGIDAYVAGTLMHDHEATIQDERAVRIATTYRIRVVFASFAGPTGGGFTQPAGRSGIWSPDGVVAAQAGPEPGDVVAATFTGCRAA
jgi:predicted amidohydrolase